MQQRSLENVASEFRAEGHAPMLRLTRELEQQGAWVHDLIFDTSMLRLLVARPNASIPEAIVTYGDGRGGGRPVNPNLDAFDVLVGRAGGSDKEIAALSAVDAVDVLRRIF